MSHDPPLADRVEQTRAETSRLPGRSGDESHGVAAPRLEFNTLGRAATRTRMRRGSASIAQTLDAAERPAHQSEAGMRWGAILSDMRRMLEARVGMTDLESSEILGLLRSIEITLIAHQIRGSI